MSSYSGTLTDPLINEIAMCIEMNYIENPCAQDDVKLYPSSSLINFKLQSGTKCNSAYPVTHFEVTDRYLEDIINCLFLCVFLFLKKENEIIISNLIAWQFNFSSVGGSKNFILKI
jgi:hypothetical protein